MVSAPFFGGCSVVLQLDFFLLIAPSIDFLVAEWGVTEVEEGFRRRIDIFGLRY